MLVVQDTVIGQVQILDTIDLLARSTAVGVGVGFSAQGSSATHANSSAEFNG